MSARSTPKKTNSRRRTGSKRSSTSASKYKEEREKRNGDRNPTKKHDHWSKMEEILKHLLIVGLGNGVPPPIQLAVKQKVSSSRRALEKRLDPLDITKPLVDLSNIISDHGVKTGAVINRHLSGIRFFMEEATKENAEDRASIISNTPPTKKDMKGVEMKKMLDRAKGILNQLSDMNELRLAIKNAVDTILKSVGYFLEAPPPAIYRIEAECDKVDDEENYEKSRADQDSTNFFCVQCIITQSSAWATDTMKNCNWKKMEGVLDHVMRVCQRPNSNKDLQQTMMTKVCESRKHLLRKSDPLQICKPLHELVDVLNRHGLESSDAAKTHLEDVQALSVSAIDNEELLSTTSSVREKNCIEVRKSLSHAKTYLNYLTELNELKMIIKNSADLIQRGCVSTVEDMPSYVTTDFDHDSYWDVAGMLREVDKIGLPSNLKAAVKVTMSRLRKILATPSGIALLQDHLSNLRESLKRKTPQEIAVACYSLIASVTDYHNSREIRPSTFYNLYNKTII